MWHSNQKGAIDWLDWDYLNCVTRPAARARTVDLLATKGNQRIASETETGKSDSVANVQKCLDAGMDMVIVVAISRASEMHLFG